MKNILLFIVLLISINSTAQTKNAAFIKEKKSSYLGNNIPKMTLLENSLNFLVLGDFGRVGNYFQKDVAREMGHATTITDAKFIISVGDNFYPDGVESTQDYQWISSFESIYSDPSLYRTWYASLGNHDYHGNVQAQLDYSKVSKRWKMPNRYYSKTFALHNGDKILMVVMDTNPFIDSYHKNPEKYAGIKEQDTLAQKKWLKETLSTQDKSIKWKIVVGHHPLYSGGYRKENKDIKLFESKFANLFDEYRVDAYLCGHEHDLQIIRPKGRYTTQFLSGAGSEVRPSGLREGSIFSASKPGFMTFSITNNQLLVQVINADKKKATVLYKFELNK
jgi:tartrate-resistant acid phosphatase type 5